MVTELHQLHEILEYQITFLPRSQYWYPTTSIHPRQIILQLATFLPPRSHRKETQTQSVRCKQSDGAINGSFAETWQYHLCSETALDLLRLVWRVLVKAKPQIEPCLVAL
jgi:hypothetical protein